MMKPVLLMNRETKESHLFKTQRKAMAYLGIDKVERFERNHIRARVRGWELFLIEDDELNRIRGICENTKLKQFDLIDKVLKSANSSGVTLQEKHHYYRTALNLISDLKEFENHSEWCGFQIKNMGPITKRFKTLKADLGIQ